MPRLTDGGTLAEHRERVSAHLIDAFEEVLAETGWDALTLREVSERAGVSRTVVYNYYRDRTALLVAWSHREMDRFLDLCERELAPVGDPLRRLELLVTLVLTEYACQRGPTVDIHGVLSPRDQAALEGHVQPLQAAVEFILRSGHDVGRMDCPDVAMGAQVVLAALESERPRLHGGGRLDESVTRLWPLVRRIVAAS